jgi:hypothetical protein
MLEPDAPLPEPVGQDVTRRQPGSQDVTANPNRLARTLRQSRMPRTLTNPKPSHHARAWTICCKRMATLRRRYERAKKRGEFPGRAVIATTELPDGTPTLHLAIESEIHEHPLRALESLAICAAILAGNRRKLRKFYVPCLDCKTPIRRSQVILARDQRCRACRARLQRERRRRKLQAKAEPGQEADSGQAERTEGKREREAPEREAAELAGHRSWDVIHRQASGNRQHRTGTARGLACCYPYMFRQSAKSAIPPAVMQCTARATEPETTGRQFAERLRVCWPVIVCHPWADRGPDATERIPQRPRAGCHGAYSERNPRGG